MLRIPAVFSLLYTSLKEDAALLCPAAGREGRAIPPVPHELMLTLGHGQLQPFDRRDGHVGVHVAELALLLRQSRDAVADDGVAVHPVVHGIAH